jgi:hypothetical protein
MNYEAIVQAGKACGVIVAWFFFLVFAVAGLKYCTESEQQRYAGKYDLKPEQVTIEKKPHDCDYQTSPLGNKNCHYERTISTVLTGITKGGRQVVSYDERKTWYFADPSVPISPSVTVSWRRIDE